MCKLCPRTPVNHLPGLYTLQGERGRLARSAKLGEGLPSPNPPPPTAPPRREVCPPHSQLSLPHPVGEMPRLREAERALPHFGYPAPRAKRGRLPPLAPARGEGRLARSAKLGEGLPAPTPSPPQPRPGERYAPAPTISPPPRGRDAEAPARQRGHSSARRRFPPYLSPTEWGRCPRQGAERAQFRAQALPNYLPPFRGPGGLSPFRGQGGLTTHTTLYDNDNIQPLPPQHENNKRRPQPP